MDSLSLVDQTVEKLASTNDENFFSFEPEEELRKHHQAEKLDCCVTVTVVTKNMN